MCAIWKQEPNEDCNNLKTTAPTLDSLAVSPDRKSVAFRDHRSGTILMAPLAGGDVRVLATAKGPASWPAAALAWSADGRFVVFADSADKKRYELWRVPVAGGESERLGFATERQITELAMHPAGRSIVVVMPDGSDPPGHYVIDRLVPGSVRDKVFTSASLSSDKRRRMRHLDSASLLAEPGDAREERLNETITGRIDRNDCWVLV